MGETFFGSLETLKEENGKPLEQLAVFTSKGRLHKHSRFENCLILYGNGFIVQEDRKQKVKEGDIVVISPRIDHYMIPGKDLMIVKIIYSKR